VEKFDEGGNACTNGGISSFFEDPKKKYMEEIE